MPYTKFGIVSIVYPEKMSMSERKKRKIISRWSLQDKQDFADRNILKSKKIPSKKQPPPEKEEWQ